MDDLLEGMKKDCWHWSSVEISDTFGQISDIRETQRCRALLVIIFPKRSSALARTEILLQVLDCVIAPASVILEKRPGSLGREVLSNVLAANCDAG